MKSSMSYTQSTLYIFVEVLYPSNLVTWGKFYLLFEVEVWKLSSKVVYFYSTIRPKKKSHREEEVFTPRTFVSGRSVGAYNYSGSPSILY